MHEIVAVVARKGLTGAVAGAAAGFVMSAAAALVNRFTGAGPPPVLAYTYKGEPHVFSKLNEIGMDLEEDLWVLEQYKSYDVAAHGVACRAVQHFINFWFRFEQDIDSKNHVVHIARMRKAAKKADGNFRHLLYAVKNAHFDVAEEEVEKASMNIHFTFENLLAEARTRSNVL
jgi:hypothetical protein